MAAAFGYRVTNGVGTHTGKGDAKDAPTEHVFCKPPSLGALMSKFKTTLCASVFNHAGVRQHAEGSGYVYTQLFSGNPVNYVFKLGSPEEKYWGINEWALEHNYRSDRMY